VADDASNKSSPFDVQTVRSLVVLMTRHDLSEIDLQDGTQRIRLRRGPRGKVVSSVVPAAPFLAAPPAAPAAPASPPAPPAMDKPAKALHEIKSETPGVFYVAPEPGAEPFVRVGSRVTPTTVVGIIMAMKVQNEIMAECSGVITEVLVGNEGPVEYGTVLFRVDTTA
jgi:acetyl-CoA carboxylase biotin carboxyl carrier protein